MSSFSINTVNLKQVSEDLKNIKNNLHRISDDVKCCSGEISTQARTIALISRTLDRVMQSIEKESVSTNSLAAALLDIAVQYQQTESKVMGIHTPFNGLQLLFRETEKKIVDILKKMGIVKGGTSSETSAYAGDPVDITSGNYVDDITELVIYGPCGLRMVRYYNSRFINLGTLGIGWSHNYEISLTDEDKSLIVTWGDQTKEIFDMSDEGKYRSRAGSYDYIIRDDDRFIYYKSGGSNYYFDTFGHLTRCVLGNNSGELLFSYGDEGLYKVEDSYGNSLCYRYNEEGFVNAVTDHAGRKVSFQYESQCLTSAEAADGLTVHYKYDQLSRIIETTGVDGNVTLVNKYDDDNRVTEQRFSDGSVIMFQYVGSEIRYTECNGAKTTYVIDDRGRIIEARYPSGAEKFEYNKYNKRIKYTDLNGHSYDREYDEYGNILTYTDPMGSTRRFVYDANGDRIEATSPDSGTIYAKYDSDHNLIERTDSLGNKTRFNYHAGLLESITYADESKTVFSYDAKGRLSSIRDENGNVTHYVYDEIGRVICEQNGCGESMYFEYDANDRYLRIINPAGLERVFYYQFGRICSLKDYDGLEEKWEYDSCGRVTAYEDKAGKRTEYSYDIMSNANRIILPNKEEVVRLYDDMNRLTEEHGPGQYHLRMVYDAGGNCIYRDENGHCAEMVYDALNRIKLIHSNSSANRKFTYDGAGRITQILREDGHEVCYKYDTEGRLIGTGELGGFFNSFEYDQRGRLIKRSGDTEEAVDYQYYPNGLVKKIRWQDQDSREYEYDAADRLIKEIYPNGYSVSYEYDSLGHKIGITDSESRSRMWEYDSAGNVVCEEDPLGRRTVFSYSPTGKLVYMRDALGTEYRYGYDSMDRLSLLLKGKMTSEEAEDILRNPDIYLNPDNNRIHLTKWVRNENGQISARIDAHGNRVEWSYRTDGQIIRHKDAEGGETRWHYNEMMHADEIRYSEQQVAKYQYNKAGWVTGISDWTGNLSINYDVHGRIISTTDYEGARILYERNPAGNPIRITYPDGMDIVYRYNENGQIAEIVSKGMSADYQYDDCGRLHQKRLIFKEDGVAVSREFVEVYGYLNSGKLKSIVYSDGYSKQMSLAFQYDDAGNMISRDQKIFNEKKGISEIRKYEYDEMNRIRRVFLEKPNGKEVVVEEYQYDKFGNCIHKEVDGVVTDCEYNVLDQLIRKNVTRHSVTEVTSYIYDKDGRLVCENCDSPVIREYNAQGNVEKLRSDKETVSFSVNSLGAVLAETYADGRKQKLYYDYAQGTMPVIGIHNDDCWQSYVRDRTLTAKSENGIWTAYVCDERGSVLQCFETGKSWKDLDGHNGYDSFGNVMNNGFSDDKHSVFGYAGLYRMPLVNTWRTATREYDPNVGRFLSRDRDDFIRIRRPETIHQYQYCFSNPMIWIDPEGTDCYIFYLPEWKNEADNDRRQLAKQYGYEESKVHLIPITSNDDFKNGWNNMGMQDGNQVDIDTVLINTHGAPSVLGDNKNFSIDKNYVSQLDDKDAENVIMYGCNSGHKDYANNNMAEAFAEKVNGAPVMASDGTVAAGFSLFNWFDRSYSSKNDKHFRKYRTNSQRDNAGWVVYQERNGRVSTIDTNDKKMTVTDMVKELRKYPKSNAHCSTGGGTR